MSDPRILFRAEQQIGGKTNIVTISKRCDNYKYKRITLTYDKRGYEEERSTVKNFRFNAPANCTEEVLLQHAKDRSNIVDELMKI